MQGCIRHRLKWSDRWRPAGGLRACILAVCSPALLLGACSDEAPTVVPRQPPTMDAPGTGPSSAHSTGTGLYPVFSATGSVYLSVDGFGTVSPSGTIEVEKRAGATVRRAFLAASSRGYSEMALRDGDLRIGGAEVLWQRNEAGAIANHNHWADVTALVKPAIDAAPAGRLTMTVAQARPTVSEGVLLAVIFDDPGARSTNTVVLLFGSQRTEGEEFSLRLREPIANPADPNLSMLMGLGISYGFQPGPQINLVDVNGRRLTSSAGGQDDTQGAARDGSLFTVGGVGDTPANPDPAVPPSSPDADNELYDLRPLVRAGDTEVRISTHNPSHDDNVFFSYFFLTVPATLDPLPPAVRTNGPYTGTTAIPVAFSSAGSSDPDGDDATLRFAWNFGDGATATGPSPSHTYAAAGTYTVRLTVTDEQGLSTTAETTATISPRQVEIDVEQPGSPARTINLSIKRQGLSQLAIVTVFGSATFDADGIDIASLRLGDGVDPDTPPNRWTNGTLMYEWGDVNGDGRRDLRVAFCLCDLELPTNTPTTYELVLRGTRADGSAFRGSRAVNVIGTP
jgi:hypothetical protein